MLDAISDSHLSPLLSSFSLLYNSSSWLSVENSKLGPSTIASTGQASYKKEIIKYTFRYIQTLIESHLTESTVDTLRHINVVASGSPTAIRPFFRLNGDRLSWANGFA